jgi:hypothetical protein
VLSFAQQALRFDFSAGLGSRLRSPLETLMEGTGSEGDLAILCAAVLSRLGFETALLVQAGRSAGAGGRPTALAIAGAEGLPGRYLQDPRSGKRYFYAQVSAGRWTLGENLAPALEAFLPVENGRAHRAGGRQ